MSEKAARGLPGDTLGPPRVHFGGKGEKRELIGPPHFELLSHILHNYFEPQLSWPLRVPKEGHQFATREKE